VLGSGHYFASVRHLLTNEFSISGRISVRASGGMADALASGASVRKDVGVQVPPRALIDVHSGQDSLNGMNADKSQELDAIAIGYDPSNSSEFFDYWFKRFEADAVSPWLRGHKVLELGGATGESAMLIAPKCNDYVIVEGSAINCAVIQRRLPNIEVINTLWEDYSPTTQFSDIILFETLEHYAEPASLLERCSRWLESNGRIHICVPNGNSLHRQVAVEMGLQQSPFDLNENDVAQGHLRNYSLRSLQDDIVSAGLNIVHVQGIFLKLVPNSMMLEWNEHLLQGLNKLAYDRVNEASNIFVVCEGSK
jgi:hypothetical protein